MVPFAIVRLILGTALLVAAALKSYQLATEPVDGGSLLSSRWFLIAVVECEFFMAAWLLTDFAPAMLRRVAPAFFCALGGVALAKAWAGEASCGYLGRWQVSPWTVMVFDASAVGAICIACRRRAALHNGRLPRWLTVAVCTLIATAALPAGVAMARYQPARLTDDGSVVGVGRHVALEPQSWVGRRFPLHCHLAVAADLEAADWIVVLVRPDCGLCQEAATRYERIASDLADGPDAPRLAIISLSADLPEDNSRDDRTVTRNAPVFGRLSDRFIWHVTTPLEILLRDGMVQRIRTALLPRAADFASL